MKKHKLLLYDQMSRRMRGRLLWLGLTLLVLAVVDLLRPFLGPTFYLLWLVVGLVVLLWLYYGILVRRAGVVVTPSYLLLQGPLRGVKISYGRISAVTSTQMAQHYDFDALKGGERRLVQPFGTACTPCWAEQLAQNAESALALVPAPAVWRTPRGAAAGQPQLDAAQSGHRRSPLQMARRPSAERQKRRPFPRLLKFLDL